MVSARPFFFFDFTRFSADATKSVTCAASPQHNETISILFTTYHDLRLANLTRPNGPPTSIDVIVKDLPEAGAFDFLYKKRRICWTDQMLQHIKCTQLDGSPIANIAQHVIISGLDKPEVIRLDCTRTTHKQLVVALTHLLVCFCLSVGHCHRLVHGQNLLVRRRDKSH